MKQAKHRILAATALILSGTLSFAIDPSGSHYYHNDSGGGFLLLVILLLGGVCLYAWFNRKE